MNIERGTFLHGLLVLSVVPHFTSFHPRGDSQHAMLGISMEKANKICIENQLPIRFEKA